MDFATGANGNIGVAAALEAEPDGYTIFMASTSTLATNPALYKNLPYDPAKDIAPIALLTKVPNVLVVKPSFPANNVKELVDLARAKSGGYTYASPGSGNLSHLSGELFKKDAGVNLVHVPYKGDAAATVDLIGGHVDTMFLIGISALPRVKEGQLKALAVTSSNRIPSLPDVPTMEELGYPGFNTEAWFGIATSSKVPADIVNTINEATVRVLQTKEFQDRLNTLGGITELMSAQQFANFVDKERQKWKKVVNETGATVD